ncbi:hypothetical protein [Paenibacillus harenae]|nr:hypothetical protein [Paenibacillus harenae]MDQ0061644.1 UDP-glucose 6-dehydrogenase [Paenibacillus harenae]
MNITVIGTGYVGLVTGASLARLSIGRPSITPDVPLTVEPNRR